MKKIYFKMVVILSICVIGILLPAGISTPLDAQKGEKVNAWIEISDRDNAAFSVLSASMTVLDWSKSYTMQTEIVANITTAAPATIKLPRIYALVDTTAAAFTSGTACRVKFFYWVDNEIKIKWLDLLIW